MKVLVCGGRDYEEYDELSEVLNRINREQGITYIIHGAAIGADRMAGDWAHEKGIQEVACPANWEHNGKSAGPVRNQAMLGLKPDLVVAFPGGRGTANMVRIAKNANVPVYEVENDIPF